MQMDYSSMDIESFAARFYPNDELSLVPYGYITTFVTLAQNTQATAIINVAANADFILLGFRHRASIGAAQTISTKTAPFVRISVSDSATNEPYTAQPVDLSNYSSDGFYDNNLSYPRLISGRSALTLQVTNYAPTAETYTTLDVFLEGVLVRVTS